MSEASRAKYRVLVTGSAGVIGQAVCEELQRRGHHVRGFDRVATPGVADHRVADIADGIAVHAAVEGMETLVHLAATPNDADFMSQLLYPNVVGVYHVCDAARQKKVRRLVLTSSVQALGHLSGKIEGRPIRVEDGALPSNHYGLTKLWAEEMGRMYALTYGLSVLAVRVTWVLHSPKDAERMETRTTQNTYLSRGDAGRFFACAVESERPAAGEYAALYANGRSNGPPRYDLDGPREVIGYEPRDAWPEGRPE